MVAQQIMVDAALRDEGSPLNPEHAELLEAARALLEPALYEATDEVLRISMTREHATAKEPAETIAKFLAKTVQFRQHYGTATIVSSPIPRGEDLHRIWPTHIGNKPDAYGHPLVFESLGQIDIAALQADDIQVADVVWQRVQVLELLARMKERASREHGHCVYKHNFIADVSGASLSLLSSKMRAIITTLLSDVTEVAYPDALHKLWIINAPIAFRWIWAVVSPLMAESTRAKINILGGKEEYLPAMCERGGLAMDEVPEALGGTGKIQTSWEILRRQAAAPTEHND